MKPNDIPSHAFRGSGEQVQAIQFAYRRSPDQDAPQPVRHPVVIVGAGPVGLTLAIDLAQRGQPVLLVDNDDRLSIGSRALCFAKRTLEIWDRLGVGDQMVDKGVSWNVGKVFLRDEQVYQFDLLPEEGHERPAFINLQQYYCEAYLVERALQLVRDCVGHDPLNIVGKSFCTCVASRLSHQVRYKKTLFILLDPAVDS